MSILLLPVYLFVWGMGLYVGTSIAKTKGFNDACDGVEDACRYARSQKQRNVDFWIPDGDPRKQ